MKTFNSRKGIVNLEMSDRTDKNRNIKIIATLNNMIQKESFLNYDKIDEEEISRDYSNDETLDSERALEDFPAVETTALDGQLDTPSEEAEETEEEEIATELCFVPISTDLPSNDELLEQLSTEREPFTEIALMNAKLLMIPAIFLRAGIDLKPSLFTSAINKQLADMKFDSSILETTLITEQCYPLGQSILMDTSFGDNRLIELPLLCFQPWSIGIPDLKNSSITNPYEDGAYLEVPLSCESSSTIESFENSCLLTTASEFGLLHSLDTLVSKNHTFPSLESKDEEENQLLIDKMRKAENRLERAIKVLDEAKKEKKIALNEAQKRVQTINEIQDQQGNKAKIQQHRSVYEQMMKEATDLSSKIKEITDIVNKNKTNYEKYKDELVSQSEKKDLIPSSKELATIILDEIPSHTKEELKFTLHSRQFFIFSWLITAIAKNEQEESYIYALAFEINGEKKILKVNGKQSG